MEGGAPANELLGELDLFVRPATWPTLVLTRVVQQVATVDISTALSWIAHLALGLRLVRTFASEAQSREFLRPPSPVFAFALTEASPGSDVNQIQTYAEPVPGGYRISGVKSWVTNAAWASHFLVFARTVPLHAGNKPRLSAFVISPGSGVSVVPAHNEVLPGAGVGELRLDRVFVPEERRIGAAGKGFRMVMAGLAEARLLVGAAATGACLRSFNDTVQRLNDRRAFGRPVGNFPSVQDRVSGMLGDVLALESLVHGVAGPDTVEKQADPVERAIVRLAASRISGRVLEGSRELFGAAAFVGNQAAARRWTDTRALTLLDGSDLALESYIVLEGTRKRRGQASLAAERDPLARLDALGTHALTQVRARVRRAFSREVSGLSSNVFNAFVLEFTEKVAVELEKHGDELIERQHVQRRLATVASELCTWHALASRVQSEIAQRGQLGSQRMLEAAQVWIAGATTRVRSQFDLLDQNDDLLRDRVAHRVYVDGIYPFDII